MPDLPPTLKYHSPPPSRPLGDRLRAPVAMVLAIVLIATAVAILLPLANRSYENTNLGKCASNEHQIGLAILLYQQDHAGH